MHLVAQDAAERLRDVPVEHDVKRVACGNALGEPGGDAFREAADALIFRRARPLERKHERASHRIEIECGEVPPDRIGDSAGIDRSRQASTSGLTTCRLRRGRSLPGLVMQLVFPLSCTEYSDAPSAVARMQAPAGSKGAPKAPASSRRRMAAPR